MPLTLKIANEQQRIPIDEPIWQTIDEDQIDEKAE
jgi:hypothetical protein